MSITASTIESLVPLSQIIEKLDFPLFKPDWLAIEEVLLLDAIATSGLGNWEAAVCSHVLILLLMHMNLCVTTLCHTPHHTTQAQNLGSKTADECRDHYYEVYFGSKCAPLPDPLDIIPGSPHTLQEMHAQAIATKPRLFPSLRSSFSSKHQHQQRHGDSSPQANGARG